MAVALQLATIILSLMLVALILLQVRGEGGLGNLLGSSDMGMGRTRRGLEKTVFQITIALSAAFLIICIFSAVVTGRS